MQKIVEGMDETEKQELKRNVALNVFFNLYREFVKAKNFVTELTFSNTEVLQESDVNFVISMLRKVFETSNTQDESKERIIVVLLDIVKQFLENRGVEINSRSVAVS